MQVSRDGERPGVTINIRILLRYWDGNIILTPNNSHTRKREEGRLPSFIVHISVFISGKYVSNRELIIFL